jgi:hypothetical protein
MQDIEEQYDVKRDCDVKYWLSTDSIKGLFSWMRDFVQMIISWNINIRRQYVTL